VAERLFIYQTPYLSCAAVAYNEPLAAPPGPALDRMIDHSDGPVNRMSIVGYAERGLRVRGCNDFVHGVGWAKMEHPLARCAAMSFVRIQILLTQLGWPD
jgi:hypothetical protein